ncbi:hypothetical protein ES702_03553 [subsurface metagenome]
MSRTTYYGIGRANSCTMTLAELAIDSATPTHHHVARDSIAGFHWDMEIHSLH